MNVGLESVHPAQTRLHAVAPRFGAASLSVPAARPTAAIRQPPLRVVPGNALWPIEFDAIEGAPTALWIRGQHALLQRRPCVAIVGTRAPTPYGAAQAARFARTLASAGALIVSGLARGIDHCAHEAALEVGGATIAVLGSGVDRPWPDTPLVLRMLEHGALVSEFEPGAPPRRLHFPLRNRLIAGLAHTVVVIEAAQASGSLITARWAVDQGKCVAALPGRVDHPMSRGCHRLLREGAQLVEDPEELAEELGLELGAGLDHASARSNNAATRVGETGARDSSVEDARTEDLGASGARNHDGRDAAANAPHARDASAQSTRTVLDALRGETLSSNEVSDRTLLPLSDVLVALVELELMGRVIRLPGGLYCRA